jgi:hypothetical protein
MKCDNLFWKNSMKIKQLIEFIDENLLKDGNLISKRCRINWFDNTHNMNMYNDIIKLTNFLPNNATLVQRLWHIYNNIFDIVLCEYDNKTSVKFKSFSDGYYNFSSSSTSNKSQIKKDKVKKTILSKYGVESYTQTEDFKNKSKKHWIEKYGVDNPSKSTVIKNKKIETCKNNYDVSWPQQSKKIRDKSITTNLSKYGVENPMMSHIIKNKTSKSRLKIEYKRFFDNQTLSSKIIPLFTVDEYDGIDKSYSFLCKRCNLKFEDIIRGGKIPRCYNCYPNTNISVGETELADYIENELGVSIIKNDRTILGGVELDIYIPDKKIAIEYNGIYFHSEISGGKSKNYHLNKTNKCKDIGIRLIHIFEDEWLENEDLVRGKLRHILGKNDDKVYARECSIIEISTSEASEFLEKNHIQGNTSSAVKIGIFYKLDLIGVMTFSKRKIFNTDDIWELVRFSTSMQIVGGFSKMLKFFEINYNPKNLITYSLRRWSDDDNNVYIKNGFMKGDIIYPGFHYVKSGKRYNRINFQKHKLKDKLEIFDYNLTEWQNMQLNGYDRLWDCGSIKYEKKYI